MTTQNNTSATTSDDRKTPEYFDQTTHARMYPHFARTVPVKGKGDDYERINMSAAFGKVGKDSLTYVSYDVKVTNPVLEDYQKVKEAINDKSVKVIMQTVVADAEPEIHEYEGESRVVMKARLMKIVWCAVDGELVIDNRRKPEADADDNTTDDIPADAKVEDRMVA